MGFRILFSMQIIVSLILYRIQEKDSNLILQGSKILVFRKISNETSEEVFLLFGKGSVVLEDWNSFHGIQAMTSMIILIVVKWLFPFRYYTEISKSFRESVVLIFNNSRSRILDDFMQA